MLKGNIVQISAILKHMRELDCVKQVLKKFNVTLRLFRRSYVFLVERWIGNEDYLAERERFLYRKSSSSVSAVMSARRASRALPPVARLTKPCHRTYDRSAVTYRSKIKYDPGIARSVTIYMYENILCKSYSLKDVFLKFIAAQSKC